METELLAPAGDFKIALSAFEAGADAVYCGLADFSARAFAQNLSFEELENLMAYARSHGKKVYITFNTLLDESALEGAVETLARLAEIGPDALIVQDLGVARLVRKHFPSLNLHASTQLVAHNLEGVLALGQLGFTRVVLARELSLEEIVSIGKRCGGIELEVFIHGALCYSLSGLCLYGAMEKGRSGNRGMCPYCCRQEVNGKYPFSMKDLRVGEDVRKLVDAGVASLKIEGRMKSALYVSSVVSYYRSLLDGGKRLVTKADLETVFSRRTTELYLNGHDVESPVDSESLGHLGTPIGEVKKLTKDRDGLTWLRFHTRRALERHDGLQFEALNDEGRHVGFGISEMRQAISRRNAFEVSAGDDVEILVPEECQQLIRSGDTVYCSMSNAVKRLFPTPSFRPSDYEAGIVVDVEVEISKDFVKASGMGVERKLKCSLEAAKRPEMTFEGVKKAFSKLGGTGFRLGELKVSDPNHLFVPMSVLNDLRRDLVEELSEERERRRIAAVDGVSDAMAEVGVSGGDSEPRRRIRIRAGQTRPAGEWYETIVVIDATTDSSEFFQYDGEIRLALPVYTAEENFNKLRNAVKRFVREGYNRWEVGDLAALNMLRQLGVKDITADWSLYAANSQALAALSELGVKRFVASPETTPDNLQYLAESGYDVEFLEQQSTPLFISLTEPASETPASLAVERLNGLYVTTRTEPRTFKTPSSSSTRVDLSWDPQ